MSEQTTYQLKINAVVQETQKNDYQFFGFIDMMQTYFNQRVAETLNRVQEQELELAGFAKGQAEEDNKLCQIIGQNQNIFQQLQRQLESFNINTETYMQNPQNLIPAMQNTSDMHHLANQRQSALEQLIQQTMNAMGVDVKVEKHIKNEGDMADQHRN